MGYDSDAEALGEFAGAAWFCRRSKRRHGLEVLLSGIPLNKVSAERDHQLTCHHHLGHVHRRGRETGRLAAPPE